jgi:hypothetical protein
MKRNTGTFIAFLLCCFAVVGLMGLFACYAGPLAYQRGLARDAALDQALATGGDKPALEALRTELDDSAAEVIDGSGPLADRVARARAAAHQEMIRDADAVAFRLRLEVVVITVVAAGSDEGGLLRDTLEGSAGQAVRCDLNLPQLLGRGVFKTLGITGSESQARCRSSV